MLTGCSPFTKKAVRTEHVIQIPELRREVVTNFVTNVVTLPATTVTNWTTNHTYEVRHELQTVLGTVRDINEFNPTPSASPVNAALIALTGILGLVAKLKSDRSKLVDTLVKGIEAANDAATVKASVANVSRIHGNHDYLDRVVQKITR